jgi:FkbM family methyltransferase
MASACLGWPGADPDTPADGAETAPITPEPRGPLTPAVRIPEAARRATPLGLRRIWHLRRADQLASLFCGPAGRARVVAKAARLAAADLTRGRTARPATLALGELGAITIRDFSELLVLWEVFVARVYDVPELPGEAGVVLDLGCNVGASLLWFRGRYPQAHLVGYEADPVTADLARRNTAGLSGVEVHATAMAGRDGEVTFWRIAGESWASGTFEPGGTPVTVPAASLDTVLDALDGPVDVLKINIEGAEHSVLAEATRLDRVRVILGQYHPGDGVSWQTLRRSLEGFEVRPAHAPDDEGRPFVAVRAD